MKFILPPDPERICPQRRRALRWLAGACALGVAGLPEWVAAMEARQARTLTFEHLHTGEVLAVVYKLGQEFIPQSLTQLESLLRDFRTGEQHPIDPALFDVLWQVRNDTRATRPFQIVSGFRSSSTNAMLRGQSAHSGVAEHSLHMNGQAIDVCVEGVKLSDLRDAALDLRAGGVGYYPSPGFVHLDTGRVRHW